MECIVLPQELIPGSKLDIVCSYAGRVTRQDGDASRQVESFRTCISGIEIERLSNRPAIAAMSVSKDDDIRILTDNTSSDIFGGTINVNNVVNQKLSSIQFNDLGFPEFEPGISVAEDGRHGSN